jgi:hypothetical protein
VAKSRINVAMRTGELALEAVEGRVVAIRESRYGGPEMGSQSRHPARRRRHYY